jgi:EAL domain-containing protein (putative c-di-GMP-specific phosphodiesterase class I)
MSSAPELREIPSQQTLGNESEERFLVGMDHALAGWNDPAAHLRNALQQDELQLYCQPILTLRSGQFEIAEVLVRMREEESALLPPGEFLPVFEHFGMMPDLDRWVVRHVIDHRSRGGRIGRFSINVSGQTLADLDFPGFVADALKSAGVPAAALLFEIDESDVLQRPPVAESFASTMKAVGCGLMIDSFARRSVSFAPLKALHVDFVKLDGSIVRNILKSPVALNKLGAVLRVGEVIGVGVIAECVEEQDILLRLKALGVGYAQGFGICQPHAIEQLLPPALVAG